MKNLINKEYHDYRIEFFILETEYILQTEKVNLINVKIKKWNSTIMF